MLFPTGGICPRGPQPARVKTSPGWGRQSLLETRSPQVKKLVYVYLVRYAEEQQDLALLSISTFQRGLKVSVSVCLLGARPGWCCVGGVGPGGWGGRGGLISGALPYLPKVGSVGVRGKVVWVSLLS